MSVPGEGLRGEIAGSGVLLESGFTDGCIAPRLSISEYFAARGVALIGGTQAGIACAPCFSAGKKVRHRKARRRAEPDGSDCLRSVPISRVDSMGRCNTQLQPDFH